MDSVISLDSDIKKDNTNSISAQPKFIPTRNYKHFDLLDFLSHPSVTVFSPLRTLPRHRKTSSHSFNVEETFAPA